MLVCRRLASLACLLGPCAFVNSSAPQVRIEEERKRQLEADEKASFRAIPGAEALLAEEEAIVEVGGESTRVEGRGFRRGEMGCGV